MQFVLVGALSLLIFGCNGGGDDDGEDNNVEKRCLRMRDHLIAVRLQPTASSPDVDVERANSIAAQHREALTAALGEDFAQKCASTMSIAQIDCVLGAEDNEAVVACSAPR